MRISGCDEAEGEEEDGGFVEGGRREVRLRRRSLSERRFFVDNEKKKNRIEPNESVPRILSVSTDLRRVLGDAEDL